MTNKPWNDRFPNPHTRPDRADPITKKARADAKRLFGKDALEEEIDFPAYLAELQRMHSTPEYQAAAAEGRREEEQRKARQQLSEQRRQIDKLSPFHVDSIRSGCDDQLRPLTTTDIQRKVIANWDGVQSLFLLGETGIGKTYTATWCAMKAIRTGKDVASTTATRVCEATLEGLIQLRQADLLLLDQLHTLRSPSGKDMPAWKVGPVVDLIDYRYERQLTTIAAGTIAPKFMVGLLGEDVKRRFPCRLASESTKISNTTEGKIDGN